ncbi:MAG: hypothetical protein ACQERN_07980 [Thermodesulfobacteriota bacterium]
MTHFKDNPVGPQNQNRVWIISEGRCVDADVSRIAGGKATGPVREYVVSDLGRYLLSPEPIEVEKRLIGCQIHYRPTPSEKWRRQCRQWLPGRFKRLIAVKATAPACIEVQQRQNGYEPKDPKLKAHVESIREALRPYEPALRELSGLNAFQIDEISGICQDPGGNRSSLNIPGTPREQIDYMKDNIGRPVAVILEKACIADGLFELKGFHFTDYDPENTHRLLKFYQDDTPRICLLNADGTPCWIDDVKLVHYMQLFEQSIRSNAKLRDSLQKCMQGEATAMKLLFNRQLEIEYSRANLPRVFREIFRTENMGDNEKAILVNYLNQQQIGVAFNYVPGDAPGDETLYADISVMQDMRALEPIKEKLPRLYSEMAKRAANAEGGRFYLLDAIRGLQK